MNKKEKEKQKVINELFHTELTHVRHLGVLEAVFFVPMRNEHIMSKDDLDNLFPNLSKVSIAFLHAASHLDKRVCPSGCPSVRRSVTLFRKPFIMLILMYKTIQK